MEKDKLLKQITSKSKHYKKLYLFNYKKEKKYKFKLINSDLQSKLQKDELKISGYYYFILYCEKEDKEIPVKSFWLEIEETLISPVDNPEKKVDIEIDSDYLIKVSKEEIIKQFYFSNHIFPNILNVYIELVLDIKIQEKKRKIKQIITAVQQGKSQKRKIINKDIIHISSTRWDYIWQRPQQLMSRISNHNRVLFVNHSISACYNEIKEKLAEENLWKTHLQQINDRLWVLNTVYLPDNKSRYIPSSISIKEFNNIVKLSAINYALKVLNFKDPLIITNLADSLEYIKKIPHQLVCYDCLDDFGSFSWTEKDIYQSEQQLVQYSDLVIASSQKLLLKMKNSNSNAYLIPNAVDYEHFKAINSTIKTSIPNSIKNLPKPIIGFIGAYYEWIDQDLLYFLADSRPNWCFVFIGPAQHGIIDSTLFNLNNIIFLGVKAYNKLPLYLQNFDVCLIPFLVNRITLSANPIKMWEYLAAGKPIVSTNIPEVEPFREIIYISDDNQDFLRKIEMALTENDHTLIGERIKVAEENDWNNRVETYLELINDYL